MAGKALGKVAVVGSSNTDLVVKMPCLPSSGETVLGSEFFISPGGKGANQAVAAARAGSRVSFIGRIGKDTFGNSAIGFLRKEGIDTRCVVRDDEAPSGVALIMVDRKGSNLIAVAPGSNAKLSGNDIFKAGSIIKSSRVLLLQMEVPLEALKISAKMAKDAGATVILNPAPAPAYPLPKEFLENIDYLIPNRKEAESLARKRISGKKGAERVLQKLLGYGVKSVILTAGSEGAILAHEGRLKRFHAIKVDAIDTVGAGDCFSGYFAAAVANNMDPADAIDLAQAAAAISVTRKGAFTSFPYLRESMALARRARIPAG